MASVFISYNRTSVDAVGRLAEDLAAMGHAVWYDQALTGGQRWWDNILEKLRESAIFMPIVTLEALDSQACKRELQYAHALDKPILPLLISRDVNTNLLPKPLGEIQLIDYSAQDKAAALALSRALAAMPATPSLPEQLPAPPPPPLSYVSDLRERLDVPLLNLEAQAALFHDLKVYWQQQGSTALIEVRQLLERFRNRRDLYATVDREIDSVLSALRTASPVPNQLPTKPSPANNAIPDQTIASEIDSIVSAPRATSPAPNPSHEKQSPATTAEPFELTLKKTPTVVPVASGKAENDDASSFAMPPKTMPARTAATTLALILQRALRFPEKWQVAADDNNYLLIDPSACAKSQIGAALTVRDNLFDTKSTALKKAGWEIDQAGVAKTLVTGGALYATGGFAALGLLSKTVRDCPRK